MKAWPLRKFRETILHLTSGQLRKPCNGTIKYGRDHGPAHEASFNPTLGTECNNK